MLIYHEFTENPVRSGSPHLSASPAWQSAAWAPSSSAPFPENTVSGLHVAGAGLAIGIGNVGIFILGAVLSLPEQMRRYMLLFSIVSITALFLFAFHKYFGVGAGTMERIAAYPETVWLIIFGLYIWRFHPKDHPTAAS